MKRLGMFARLPTPGHTKTRLAAAIGDEAAAELYKAFVLDLATRCAPLADEFCVAVTPDKPGTSRWFADALPTVTNIVFQSEGGLGHRIRRFFETTIRSISDTVVLIGSDSPDLPQSIIDDAFRALQQTDVVIAPAMDGGFVLIGLRVPPHDLFDDIRWSHPATLLDTLAAARRRGHSVAMLSPWYDVDTIDNLGTLTALLTWHQQNSPSTCPHTVDCLASLKYDWSSM